MRHSIIHNAIFFNAYYLFSQCILLKDCRFPLHYTNSFYLQRIDTDGLYHTMIPILELEAWFPLQAIFNHNNCLNCCRYEVQIQLSSIQNCRSFCFTGGSLLSTNSLSTIPGIVRFEIVLNSTNSPIQYNFFVKNQKIWAKFWKIYSKISRKFQSKHIWSKNSENYPLWMNQMMHMIHQMMYLIHQMMKIRFFHG